VLVTGGAGFIGSQYVRTARTGGLQDLAGAEVVVLDKLTSAGDLDSLAAVSAAEPGAATSATPSTPAGSRAGWGTRRAFASRRAWPVRCRGTGTTRAGGHAPSPEWADPVTVGASVAIVTYVARRGRYACRVGLP